MIIVFILLFTELRFMHMLTLIAFSYPETVAIYIQNKQKKNQQFY